MPARKENWSSVGWCRRRVPAVRWNVFGFLRWQKRRSAKDLRSWKTSRIFNLCMKRDFPVQWGTGCWGWMPPVFIPSNTVRTNKCFPSVVCRLPRWHWLSTANWRSPTSSRNNTGSWKRIIVIPPFLLWSVKAMKKLLRKKKRVAERRR